MKNIVFTLVIFIVSVPSFAHISIITEPHFSNTYSQFEFAVPHGCQGFDTLRLEMTLPSALTRVRPLDSVFGSAIVQTNDQEEATKIIWTKSTELYESDSHAYTVALRAKTPDTPFVTLYFPVVQVCLDADQNEIQAAWVGMGGHDHGAESSELPAPSALLNPPRKLGWNNYYIDQHLHDLSIFNDAEIVWMENSAYSSSDHTMQLILEDENVQLLEMIHPGSEIWVKY